MTPTIAQIDHHLDALRDVGACYGSQQLGGRTATELPLWALMRALVELRAGLEEAEMMEWVTRADEMALERKAA